MISVEKTRDGGTVYMDLNGIFSAAKRLHFIGIGGSGMFPMVQIFHGRGYTITGSDNNEGDTVELERGMGIPVTIGHRAENIGNAQAVIYTAAIMPDNVELNAARQAGLPVLERAEVLGYITRQYNDCVCVSGTHGKTTVTAMLTQILLESGFDPSAVIGGKLPLIGGNGRAGSSSLLVCEACEFADHFLTLSPAVSVILNVDADHLEYFGSLENIIASFRKFAALTARTLIVNGDDENAMRAVKGMEKEIITFGRSPQNEYYAREIQRTGPASTEFTLMHKESPLIRLALHVPGEHNILNAVAACTTALLLGATPQQLADTLPGFRGAGRRFEILGNVRGITIADDYAHHPAELEVTLRTAKEMGYGRVWAVFQPFTYSRTAMLLEDFAKSLSIADRVVMSEIMGAREKNTYGVYTKDLAEKIPGSVWFPGFDEMAEYVMQHAADGDLVLTLGCGDVYKCAKLMLKQ